ncbi:MAG: signal recognition particle-docking protein FtsY [Pseudomonadota bacterium]|nr:signal recognition particle-docking protein FtsY [Pseudomonadota bacterium]
MNQRNWLTRLRVGLGRSSKTLNEGIAGIFQSRQIDPKTLEELEDLLITADLGPQVATTLSHSLGNVSSSNTTTTLSIKRQLAQNIGEILQPLAQPIELMSAGKPTLLLFVGVNGTGKTTTVGKLAAQLSQDGTKIGIVAADTFRAAATEQLQRWGERAGCPVFAGTQGSDPSSLVYSATQSAEANGFDGLLIDTAGRLHTKHNLMEELIKMTRVLKKLNPSYPHGVIQVLDATTGQNALSQVASFKEAVPVSGLIVTKLDGSAKGGVIIALADRFGIPIHAVGVGEDIDDLQTFVAEKFTQELLGLNTEVLE